jgi:chromosome segregation ATPase
LLGDEMNLKCGACAVIERRLSNAADTFSEIVTEIARLRGQIAELRAELNRSQKGVGDAKTLIERVYTAWQAMPIELEQDAIWFLNNGNLPVECLRSL